jgi:N-acyl-D-aspartate/D-glutamate deacylase
MYDLLIRRGTIVDGTGEPARTGDVAVKDGKVVAVGPDLAGEAAEVIDADGLLVTPGFVDIHTHYDGQATWDEVLDPSAGHGVTTVVMGNCGVGFAPVHPGQEDWLIQLMEGVEDIPGTALAEGMTWGWESFPEYLDALDQRKLAIDIGTQVAHGAVRGYVMGERGAKNEPATPDDIDAMAAIVKEAIEAGALGFSTSRTLAHRAIDGEPVPGTFAAEDELFGIGRTLGEVGRGVFELAPAAIDGLDAASPFKEIDWMRRLSAEIDRPVSFALLQLDPAPTLWRELMDESLAAIDAGAQLRPQVASRPFGLLTGLQTHHVFAKRPTYMAMADLPLDERVVRMKDPSVREAILDEDDAPADPSILFDGVGVFLGAMIHNLYVMGDPPDYEPTRETSIGGLAEAEGRTMHEVLYDRLLDDDGRALLMLPLFNYSDGDHEAIREQLTHPTAVLGLGDGGAHCGMICDASLPTYTLTHWARDRSRGERLPLEWLVRKQTRDTAELYGLTDRGTIEAGQRADLNVIDHEGLTLRSPRLVHDLPAGGRRLIQEADGYVATIVAGEVTRRHGQDTGARPGRLIRGGAS